MISVQILFKNNQISIKTSHNLKSTQQNFSQGFKNQYESKKYVK